MTLDEAIKHAEEVADKKERDKQKWERWLETDSDSRAVAEKVSCELCAEEHRQLAEWLKELKQLREQTRWIPVSERLPKKAGDYLVVFRYMWIHRREVCYFDGKSWDKGEYDEIIKWQYLPNIEENEDKK